VKEVLTNQADWPAALANGEIDGGAPLSYNPDVAQRLRSTTGVSTALGGSGATWEHVELNLKSSALADPALRRAMLTALDVKDLRARLFGEVTPAFRRNPLFPPQSPHNEDVLNATGFGTGDLAAARRVLAEAGYTGAAAGQRLAKRGSVVPDLRFAYIAGHPTRETFVEVAQQRLAEIGLTVRPVGVPGPDFGTTLRTGAFDLTIFAIQSGPLFTQAASAYYRTGSGINFPGVSDPALDRAADAVLMATDLEEAAAHANEVAERVMASAAVLPLWDNPSYVFVRNTFVNVRDNPLSNQRAMYNIGAWGVSANR
jgi:peptide/nickel transport system substrate-binding protein